VKKIIATYVCIDVQQPTASCVSKTKFPSTGRSKKGGSFPGLGLHGSSTSQARRSFSDLAQLKPGKSSPIRCTTSTTSIGCASAQRRWHRAPQQHRARCGGIARSTPATTPFSASKQEYHVLRRHKPARLGRAAASRRRRSLRLRVLKRRRCSAGLKVVEARAAACLRSGMRSSGNHGMVGGSGPAWEFQNRARPRPARWGISCGCRAGSSTGIGDDYGVSATLQSKSQAEEKKKKKKKRNNKKKKIIMGLERLGAHPRVDTRDAREEGWLKASMRRVGSLRSATSSNQNHVYGAFQLGAAHGKHEDVGIDHQFSRYGVSDRGALDPDPDGTANSAARALLRGSPPAANMDPTRSARWLVEPLPSPSGAGRKRQSEKSRSRKEKEKKNEKKKTKPTESRSAPDIAP